MNISLNPPSGTSDYYPLDIKFRDWLLNIWSDISKQYSFFEYDAPIIENSTLYTYKEGNDILKEMFKLESNDLVLRPEMTPSLARMIINKIPSEIVPIKWFSKSQCWRNETTTRGRRREFYQWNVDIFCGENVKSELELFSMLVSFFKKIGLTSNDVVIKVSNRKIIQKILLNLGAQEHNVIKILNIIDKMDKLPKDEIRQLFSQIDLENNIVDIIYNIISVKDIKDIEKFINNDDIDFKETSNIFLFAQKIGISDWLQFDASIVRGLSYYNGIVFEGYFKNTQVSRAICGGGRYDNILCTYGYNKNVSSIGFGMGNCVIMEGLQELNLLPELFLSVDYVVIPFNDEYYCDAFLISEKVRNKGFSVDLYSKKGKIKNAFSYADRKNAKFVIYVASEWKDGNIVVKNLKSNENKQITINFDEFLDNLV